LEIHFFIRDIVGDSPPPPNASGNANGKIIKLLRRRVGTSLNTFENIFGHIVGT
jgi:hypothetical protein